MKLISIICPVYNCAEFIEETITSVINQTYSHWELLLIDDGSTDDSHHICQEFQKEENRIKVFSKNNGGQASARNYGIQKSQGELITFIDSDDLYASNKLEAQIATFNNTQADFYYGGGYTLKDVEGKDREIGTYDWVYGQFSGVEFFKILFKDCAVNINTVLVKRELFDYCGYFDEAPVLRGTEDLDLWLRIADKVEKIHGNPERLVYYRLHEGGIHLQRARMLIGKIHIYEKYEQSTKISALYKKREYRYVYRELMNQLIVEDRINEVKTYFKDLCKKDKNGLTTNCQKLIFFLFNPKTFNWISTKILYRIGYRLEKFQYKIKGI